MRLEEFDYELPQEFIAQTPAEPRDSCKLMVLDRRNYTITHAVFYQIGEFLRRGDVLVLNDTKVLPARLFGKKVSTGAKIEVLLLKQVGADEWLVMAKPARRLKAGTVVDFGEGLEGEVVQEGEGGQRVIRFRCEGDVREAIYRAGYAPLPPYIKRNEVLFKEEDKNWYQTVFARQEGAIAAPTAGLHFTQRLLEDLKEKGIQIEYITLHVGRGTFEPVRVEDVRQHRMGEEWYRVPEDVAGRINEARQAGGRIVACGTTVVRALEKAASSNGRIRGGEGWSDVFIYPGYEFKAVDVLITNFHLPKSTPLLLVCAFAGRDFIFRAYEEAKREGYRFFSYGDGMLIL